MAHLEQLNFVKILSEEIYLHTKFLEILEIGSYDVNGSIRAFFENSQYIGVDLIAGNGVDVVGDGHTIDYPSQSFDMVISCESFEHNPYWKETFLNMIRMTKDGGIVAFTCATLGRAEHGTTRTTSVDSPGTIQMNWDYYKNLEERDFTEISNFKTHFKRYFFIENTESKDLYFLGIKAGHVKFNISLIKIKWNYKFFQMRKLINENKDTNKILKYCFIVYRYIKKILSAIKNNANS